MRTLIILLTEYCDDFLGQVSYSPNIRQAIERKGNIEFLFNFQYKIHHLQRRHANILLQFSIRTERDSSLDNSVNYRKNPGEYIVVVGAQLNQFPCV